MPSRIHWGWTDLPGNGQRESLVVQGVKGADVTEEQIDKIYRRELKKISRKVTHTRYYSFLVYFGVVKRFGWMEPTGETEASIMQDNYSLAPSRTNCRLTKKGKEAGDELWSNPLSAPHQKAAPVI